MRTITVLLVDDHILFREGLAGLLEACSDIRVVGGARSGEEAIQLARELMPDLILIDARMGGTVGLHTTRVIKAEMPEVKIVMLTTSEDESDLFEAIKCGAQGYVLKNTPPDELCRYLTAVFAGEAPVSGVMASRMLREFTAPVSSWGGEGAGQAQLSEREWDVLNCLAEGLNYREVAEKLFISENTVRKHLRNILAKLHLQNRVQAALQAEETRFTLTY